MTTRQLIDNREIPSVLARADGTKITSASEFEEKKKEIRALLEAREYGKLPKAPEKTEVTVTETLDNLFSGDAVLNRLSFSVTVDGKTGSFPVYEIRPTFKEGPLPAFVFINFRPDIFDKYLPAEEIIDRGYAIYGFCYEDVATDDNDFSTGLAPMLCPDRTAPDAPGKIAMWAWAAMRIMDYVQTLPYIDHTHVGVIGHSRLGKTALVTGAFDERFTYVISNDSGCAGAALERGKVGEHYDVITNVFPFWFCPRFNEDGAALRPLPFDQNFLLALTVPRHLLIGSAILDEWADPASEYLNLVLTNEVYALYGLRGLVHPDALVPAETTLNEGDAAYHVRRGIHYLSRRDWVAYMDYIDAHR